MSEPGSAAADPGLRDQLERARGLGLLGPGPVADHVVHSLGFLPALAGVVGHLVDLGSGGGVPGLPIALARPDLRITLVDASARRAAFLDAAVRALELESRAEVVLGRAELLGHGALRGTADAVVARSFGPPAATAECAAPLLRPGGILIVSEPPEAQGERWPASPLEELGLVPGAAWPGPPRLQVLEQVTACPHRFPRRDGVPAKRPLF